MYLTPDMHVATVWLLEAERGNILASLVRETSGPWVLQVTSRIFVDDKIVDSKDLRAMNTLALSTSDVAEATRLCEDRLPLLAAILLRQPFTLTRIDVNGDTARALALLNEHPSIFSHMPKGSVEA